MRRQQNETRKENGSSDDLRRSPMMDHLLTALEEGTDIGHYGRLTFVMIARYFLDQEEITSLLANQPEMDETEAKALYLQVVDHDYNPPKRARVLAWQEQQQFPICPTPEDPSSCNVYNELQFPGHIYDNIEDYWEGRAEETQQEETQQTDVQ